jgi:hypothetical protein
MDHRATLMALVLVSSALAGCSGGDADGGGNDEIDSEALQNLFDEHFQDFINNTTITVINNYHNNTTYVVDENYYSTNNEYNNTTYMDGGEVNNYITDNSNYTYGFGPGVSGNVSSSGLLFVVELEWDAIDMFPEYGIPGDRNNSFSVTWTYWDYPTNQERTDTFDFDCTEYYIFETVSAQNNSYYWGTYWESSDPYYDAWDNQYNDTIADILQNVAWSEYIRGICDDDFTPSGAIVGWNTGYVYPFLNITVPEGYAIAYRQENFCVYQGAVEYAGCDYYGYTVNEHHPYGHPRHSGAYQDSNLYIYGGWDDITIEFEMYVYGSSNFYIYPDTSYYFILYYELIPVMQHVE